MAEQGGVAYPAGGAGMKAERNTDITPGPGGVMTVEVGVVTGELTLSTELSGNGEVTVKVQYKGADEWYTVQGGKAKLADKADADAVHAIAVGLLNRPSG
jgi:hypothetical protein